MSKKLVLVLISVIIFSFAQQRDSIVRVGTCETPGSADGVFTQGQYAYIADRGRFTSIDISVPENPFVSDFSSLEWPTGVYVVDTLAFLNAALAGPAFAIFNISDPSNLIRISWILVPDGGLDCKGVITIDTLVYFADGLAGLLIISISDLLNPLILCTLDTPGEVYDLYVRDTLTFLADRDSLLIVNVSDPSNPVIIGHIDIPGGGAYDVWVTGNYAFVTEDDWFGGQGKVNMIEISDPTSPTLVEQISMAATPYGLFVVNDKIYIAADDWWSPGREKGEGRADIEGGIRIVHWEEPDSMSLLASFDTPGRCRDIFVVDSFIHIAAWDSFMIYKYVTTGIEEKDKKYIESFELLIKPNPFNISTTIQFQSQTSEHTVLKVFDVTGKLVKEFGQKSPIVWDGRDNQNKQLPSGIYIVQLMVSNVTATRKAILLE